MVAPGIAEALIATAVGLFAAIPATIFYNFFVGAPARAAGGDRPVRAASSRGTSRASASRLAGAARAPGAERWPRRTSAASTAPLSEINVTPFVDVMLVLLIIFMVTAPMMQQGIDVDLPETTTQPLRCRTSR